MVQFSEKLIKKTEEKFCRLLKAAGERTANRISELISKEKLTPPERFAVKWLYANSPLSDAVAYGFELFCAAARHGIFLRETSPFAAELPEEIFLCYVLHSRVNEEELCDCRGYFYRLLKDRIRGMNLEEAVIELNTFHAENVVYRSTDERTRSALAVFESGAGRCGEESVFAVNVFRALGIAARQVYAPRWSHCDDNHAWVEIYSETSWRFLGACEPEETLDRGWFNAAASRAMLVRARVFCDPPEGEPIGKKGAATDLNALKTYADTEKLRVFVCDESGEPVPGAEVSFEILNYAQFFPVAAVRTGADGYAELICGRGSFHLCARKGAFFAETTFFVAKSAEARLVLKQEPFLERRERFVFYAPQGRKDVQKPMDRAQREKNEARKRVAAEKYREKASSRIDLQIAERVAETCAFPEKILELLKKCASNFNAIASFLREDGWETRKKEELLFTLPEKDLTEIDPDILREALIYSEPLRQKWGDEFFLRYVVCPRIDREPLSLWRKSLLEFFSEAQKRAFCADPRNIAEYLRREIVYQEEYEYDRLIVPPLAALQSGRAGPLSKKILFVAVCRALGIPARIDPVTKEEQFFENGKFVFCSARPEGELELVAPPCGAFRCGEDFSLTRLGEPFPAADLSGIPFENGRLSVRLPCGNYRLITSNRLPNGNSFAQTLDFSLCEEKKEILLEKYEADLADMLFTIPLSDFRLFSEEGEPLAAGGTAAPFAAFIWLKAGQEPTEHLLNEILARKEEFAALSDKIFWILPDRSALGNEKLQEAMRALPNAKVLFDGDCVMSGLARRVFQEPEKYPLAVLVKPPLTAVYACGGYNVGSGDLIFRIMNYLEQN